MNRTMIQSYSDNYKRRSFTDKLQSLYQAYGRPSGRKAAIWSRIEHDMHNVGGHGLSVLTHSCHFFTCAFVYRNQFGLSILRIYTPSDTIEVPMY